MLDICGGPCYASTHTENYLGKVEHWNKIVIIIFPNHSEGKNMFKEK